MGKLSASSLASLLALKGARPVVIQALIYFIIVLVGVNFGLSILGIAPKHVYYWGMSFRDSAVTHFFPQQKRAVVYTTNLQGLREKNTITPFAPPHSVRIAYLGASEIFGYGNQDDGTVTRFLQRELREKLQSDNIEVVNFGITGNPIDFFWIFKSYVTKVHADIVVVALLLGRNTYYSGNLFGKDNRETMAHWLDWMKREDPDPEARARNRWLWNLPLYRWVFRRLNNIDYKLFNVAWPGPAKTQEVKLSPQNVALAAPGIPSVWSDMMLHNPATRRQREREADVTLDVVREMKVFADQQNIPLHVLFIPSPWQLPTVGRPAPKTTETDPYDLIDFVANGCRERKIECSTNIERISAYASQKSFDELTFDGGHYFDPANAVIADMTTDLILDEVRTFLQRKASD
jgi:hypothetical protein